MNLADLKAPFDPKRISWRVGSTNKEKTRGMALAYLDSRDVQDRLDAVCGPAGWQCRYHLLGQTTVCEIGIMVSAPIIQYVGDAEMKTPAYKPVFPSEWVWKADGAGETDFEGQKGALSDAFKRAAVKWGIGRYLYDVDAPWVEVEAFGNPAKPSYKIAPKELPRLAAALAGEGMISHMMKQAPPKPTEAPRQDRIEALKEEGREAAEGGVSVLYVWWMRQTADDRKLLVEYKDTVLKPLAEKAA